MQDYVDRLEAVLESASPALREIPEAKARTRPSSGGWSPSEVIGHLVDSASNNHQRFVRAQFRESIVFEGYDSDDWVNVQKYNNAPWDDLVTLWRSFDEHMARVMRAIPEAVRTRAVTDHNLDQIAWQTVPRERATTLEYFMSDYVAHMEHHLGEVLGAEWSAVNVA